MEIIEKIWGHEEIIVNDPVNNYCGKILHLTKGYVCSYHYHEIKHETFYVLKGLVKFIINDMFFNAKPKDKFIIPPNTIHSFEGITNAEILEISNFDLYEDSIRLTRSRKI